MDSVACNTSTGYVISQAKLYVHLPDSLVRDQGSYFENNNYKVLKNDIDLLSPTGLYNIDFIYLVSYTPINNPGGSVPLFYDYMVRSVNVYKSPVPLVIALVGQKDINSVLVG